ncbi:MAG: hypothetical protein FD161_4809 [Limisphaerales bacterium]|nr:MAG: hypothetical protein FD161_4809 [Limisphaerales bacterium]TNC96200.1 MAG: hypothetical protein FD118_4166 [Rhodocyclaceae bacterium]
MPSPLLALVALGIAHRFRPSWVAVELGQAAKDAGEDVGAERLSRIIARALTVFEPLLQRLTQRGRPPADRGKEVEAELRLTQALLAVASAILGRIRLRRPMVRELIVGAWLRLSKDHCLTQDRFAAMLGIKPRTLRAWLKSGTPPAGPGPIEEAKKAPRARQPRPPRRRRFGFDLVLPDTMEAADTTDISAFGVSLKLIAAQDVGGRDEDLLDGVIVDDHESADHVVTVLTNALKNHPGAQALTDQGPPYMAKKTRKALAALAVEHAPQKEGHPQGKSTIERAFASVKSFARPMLSLTDRLAEHIPVLRDKDLAKAATTVVLITVLRAYQAGARAAKRAMEARALLTDEAAMTKVAAESRERARADDRSSRLLLGHIHDVYRFPGARRTFVDALRAYPPEVLRSAEQALRGQVHRDDIRDRSSYFAAIVRAHHDAHRRRRADQVRHQELLDRLQNAEATCRREQAEWASNPAAQLRASLKGLAESWLPRSGTLLAGGAGLPAAWMRSSLSALAEMHGTAVAQDIAAAVSRQFSIEHHDRLGQRGLRAVEAVLRRALAELVAVRSDAAPVVAALLGSGTSAQQTIPPTQRATFRAIGRYSC